MQKYFPEIILGASFYGCGLAGRNPAALVIEPTITVGSDFAFAFQPGQDLTQRPKHPEAQEFYDDAQRRRALLDGRLQIAALIPALSDWCWRRQLRIALQSAILSYSTTTVLIQNVEGQYQLEAERVLDARAKPGKMKFFSALAFAKGLTIPDGTFAHLQLQSGAIDGQYYLQLALPADCSWPEARQRFYIAWAQRDPALQSLRLTLTASRFAYTNWKNPFQALESGLCERGTCTTI